MAIIWLRQNFKFRYGYVLRIFIKCLVCFAWFTNTLPLVTRFSIEFHLLPAIFFLCKRGKKMKFYSLKKWLIITCNFDHIIIIPGRQAGIWHQMGWLCVKQFSCSLPDLCIVILSCTLLQAQNIPKDDRVKLTMSLFLSHQVKTKNDNCPQTVLALFSAGVISHNWLKESGLFFGGGGRDFRLLGFRDQKKAHYFSHDPCKIFMAEICSIQIMFVKTWPIMVNHN